MCLKLHKIPEPSLLCNTEILSLWKLKKHRQSRRNSYSLEGPKQRQTYLAKVGIFKSL